MRDHIHLSVLTVSSRSDEIVKKLSTVINISNKAIKQHNSRMCAHEQKVYDISSLLIQINDCAATFKSNQGSNSTRTTLPSLTWYL